MTKLARGPVQTFPPSAHGVDFEFKKFELSSSARNFFPEALGAAGAFDVRLHPAFSVFAASLILLTPFQAYAQEPAHNVSVRDRPRPEYDPLGMRFGGFDLNASVDLGVSTTDNLFATETGEDSDTLYTIAPEARLSSHWSRHALSVAAGYAHTSHQDFGSEDADTGYVTGHGRIDVTEDTQILADARFAHEVEPRTNPDALTIGKPVEYNVSRGSVTAAHVFNRIRVSGTVSHSEYDYHDAGAIDQDFRDSTENAGALEVDYALSPRLDIVARGTSDHRKYKNDPAFSSDGNNIQVGAAIHLTDLMEGQLTVGEFSRDYNYGQSVDGTAIDGNLEWYITQLTTLSFSAHRGAQDSGGTTADPYVESRYGAHIDHELLRNVILSAGIERGTRDYRLIDRNDDYTHAGLGAQYILNRRVALNAGYTHDEVNSDGLNRYRDYTVNAFTLGVSLRL